MCSSLVGADLLGVLGAQALMDGTGCAGVLGFEEDGGFYLLHSTPNFPDNPADDEYHGTGSTLHVQGM